jgi:hypothetical protein
VGCGIGRDTRFGVMRGLGGIRDLVEGGISRERRDW